MTTMGLLAISSSKRGEALVPSDQVTISVTGMLGGVTTSPALSPQFSSSISDCGVGVNVITFHWRRSREDAQTRSLKVLTS